MVMGNALPNFNSDRDLLYVGACVSSRVSPVQHQQLKTGETLYGDFCRDEQCTCILHEKYQKVAVFQALLVQNMTLQSTFQKKIMKNTCRLS